MSEQHIYFFGDGQADGDASMKDLLGGKGAGLAEMTNAGLPTPPGFTITTEACNDYFAAGKQLPAGLWDDVVEAVHEVEREAGKGFGDPSNPLLVSVRSGARFSMPGMMDTVLNLGLNEQTLRGLVSLTANERFRHSLDLGTRSILHGEQQIELMRPIVAGDRLSVVTRVADVQERAGASGPSDVIVLEDEGKDEKGELVFRTRATLILRRG